MKRTDLPHVVVTTLTLWLQPRYRKVQCVEYVDGIPMAVGVNGTSCWDSEDTAASREAFTERSCRNVACLAMFLDVSGGEE